MLIEYLIILNNIYVTIHMHYKEIELSLFKYFFN